MVLGIWVDYDVLGVNIEMGNIFWMRELEAEKQLLDKEADLLKSQSLGLIFQHFC